MSLRLHPCCVPSCRRVGPARASWHRRSRAASTLLVCLCFSFFSSPSLACSACYSPPDKPYATNQAGDTVDATERSAELRVSPIAARTASYVVSTARVKIPDAQAGGQEPHAQVASMDVWAKKNGMTRSATAAQLTEAGSAKSPKRPRATVSEDRGNYLPSCQSPCCVRARRWTDLAGI
jgi:hypothetical protein